MVWIVGSIVGAGPAENVTVACMSLAEQNNLLLLLLLLLLYLSPLCRVFTVIYLKKNHVSMVCSVAAVLYLQSVLHVTVFPV